MIQRYFLKRFLVVALLAGFVLTSYAQKDTTNLNQQVEVVKAYKPSVANAQRINLLPDINDTTKFRPDLNYKTIAHPITTGFKPTNVRAYDQFQREIIYPGYGKISGGIGSYQTPFLDFYLSNPNSQNGTLGLQLNHLSSNGSIQLRGGSRTDAPFSYNRALVFGSYVLEGVTISSELNYQRDMNRFYGYPVEIPADIMTNNFTMYFGQDQLNQHGYFNLAVKSNASSKAILKFNSEMKLGYFSTSSSQIEKEISLKGNFDYDFGAFAGKLNAAFDHFNTDNVTENPDLLPTFSRTGSWLQLAPSINYQTEYLTLEGGLNLYAVTNDPNGTTLKLYPKAQFSYHSSGNKLIFHVGMDGYLQNNNYSKIAEENRWINPTLEVGPSNHMNVLSAGIKGKITTKLAYDLGLKYSKTVDQYFYATMVENRSGNASPTLKDLTYNNAFEVVYDNLSTVDFSGNLTYTSSDLFMMLAGHFYNYETNNLEKAPYQPDFTLDATANYKVTDKILATADFFLTGPRNIMLKFHLPIWASSMPPPPIYLQTDAMVDVNVGAKYLFNKNLEFIGEIENLLNRMDEPWYGYTVQGLRFKVGASFSF
ncbi:MAG: hypothetical protein M0R39_16515 [Prolixibacteraceae bacterium]|nr:hypothetical protein [Prolixibacteraceae bacterium]